MLYIYDNIINNLAEKVKLRMREFKLNCALMQNCKGDGFMQYMLLIGAAVLLAADFSLNKIYQKLKGTSPAASFGFNSILGLFTAIIFFGINGFKLDFSYYSLIMAVLVNGFAMSYNIIGFRLLKSSTMAMYTLFLMSGGMVIPYAFGLVFLNETFSVLKTMALILILAGVIFSNVSNEKVNSKQIIMCVAVFILNGLVSTVSKLHQIEPVFRTVDATGFVLLGGLVKFIIAGIIYLFVKKRTDDKTQKRSWVMPAVVIISSAVAGGASYLLQLWGAISVPATVLYPFVTGGSIVLSSLFGKILFKEKLSRNLIIGVILCFIGTVMFL